MELRILRRGLVLSVLIAILTLALVTFRFGPHLRRTGLAIGLASALFWAIPYFSPGLTHGPGDALLLLTLAGLTIYYKNANHINAILPLAAGLGAVVVFFEVLTGQLPVAGSWLAALTLATGRDVGRMELTRPIAIAVGAVIAFGFGAISTVILKQALAFLLVESTTATQVLTQLRLYMGVPVTEGEWPGRILPIIRLVQKSHVLTYGNRVIGYLLLTVTLLAWITAIIRGWRQRHNSSGIDVIFLAASALIPFVWVLVWPNHTLIHSDFMVRILVVPVALCPLACSWPSEKFNAPDNGGRAFHKYDTDGYEKQILITSNL